MAEQTSLVAQQVRLMHWAEQIRECQNRPVRKVWVYRPGVNKITLQKPTIIIH